MNTARTTLILFATLALGTADARAQIAPRYRLVDLGSLGGQTGAMGINNAHQLDTWQLRKNPGVMSTQMTDADDADAEAHAASVRPMIDIPASSAARMIASPSIISVFPASTDNAVAPARRIASMVATPTTGTSKRMS